MGFFYFSDEMTNIGANSILTVSPSGVMHERN